jgi:hypothetical protein
MWSRWSHAFVSVGAKTTRILSPARLATLTPSRKRGHTRRSAHRTALERSRRTPSFWLPITLVAAFAASIVFSGVHSPLDALATDALDLLRAEELETVLFDTPVSFAAPDGKDIVIDPGTYRVVAQEGTRLELISTDSQRTVQVEAATARHQDSIATSIALYVVDEQQTPHIALLMPTGTRLEAIGSVAGVRPRGIVPLLSHRANLSLEGRRSLRKLLRANKRLATACLLKEEFGQLWSYRREGWARQFFTRWHEQLTWQRLQPFEKFAALIERHWDGIAAYCEPRNKVKLGFVEGPNNKIRVIQRRAYGYRDEEYMRLKILTAFLPKK